ncbi:hypothetical protein Q1695_007708 [Nippostrongylus brasiliensis]|nr:hypothetical protein Q1695_007708 [Nippostrongylus brasiliensis]
MFWRVAVLAVLISAVLGQNAADGTTQMPYNAEAMKEFEDTLFAEVRALVDGGCEEVGFDAGLHPKCFDDATPAPTA